jgi:hypothetical protein
MRKKFILAPIFCLLSSLSLASELSIDSVDLEVPNVDLAPEAKSKPLELNRLSELGPASVPETTASAIILLFGVLVMLRRRA